MIFVFTREERGNGSSERFRNKICGWNEERQNVEGIRPFSKRRRAVNFSISKKGANYRRASQTSFSFYTVQVQTLSTTTIGFTKKSHVARRFKFYSLDIQTYNNFHTRISAFLTQLHSTWTLQIRYSLIFFWQNTFVINNNLTWCLGIFKLTGVYIPWI